MTVNSSNDLKKGSFLSKNSISRKSKIPGTSVENINMKLQKLSIKNNNLKKLTSEIMNSE